MCFDGTLLFGAGLTNDFLTTTVVDRDSLRLYSIAVLVARRDCVFAGRQIQLRGKNHILLFPLPAQLCYLSPYLRYLTHDR